MDLLRSDQFERGTTTWSDLWTILRSHKRVTGLAFLATMLSVYVSLEFITERYETKAALLVKLGRENSEVPATVEKGSFLTTGVRKEELNSEIQILSSRDLIRGVVDRLGPDAFKFELPPPKTFLQSLKFYAKKSWRWTKEQSEAFLIIVNLKKELTDQERAILAVEEALTVEAEKDSDVISVKLRLPSPGLCVRVADLLLQLYMERHARVRQSDGAKDFFDTEAANRLQELQTLETQREKVREKWNLSSVDEQRKLLLKQLSELNDQLGSDESERAKLRRQQDSMGARLDALPEVLRKSEVVTPNPSTQSIKDRITTLQLERAKMLGRYNPNSQPIKNLDEQIASLQALLSKEDPTLLGSVTSEPNPLKQNFANGIEEINVKVAGLDARAERLRAQAAEVESQIRSLNSGEDQLKGVEREHQIAEQNYLAYTRRKEEARISEELDQRNVANVVVLSSPTTPIEPVYPRRLLIMGLALPVGLLLGIVLGLVFEYFNDTIRTSRDLSGLEGLAYFGSFRLDAAKD